MNHDENSQSYVEKSFNDALNLVVENGQVSVSILQRKMKIGYGRAEMYIKEMEKMDIFQLMMALIHEKY